MPITTHFYRDTACRFSIALLLMVSPGCRRSAPFPEGILAEAQAKMQNADFSGARDALLMVTAAQPRSLTAYVNLGLAYWQLGDLTAADAAFNRATELAPTNDRIWELLGHLYIQSENYEGAAEVFMKVNKPSAVTLALKALAEQKAGNNDFALHYLTLALKQDRFYPPALYNLAILHRDNFDAPPDALAAWRQFREADPQNARAGLSDDAFLKAGHPPADTRPQAPLPAGSSPEPLTETAISQQAPATGTQADKPQEPERPKATERKPLPIDADQGTLEKPETPAPPTPKVKIPVRTLIRKADGEIAAGNHDAALMTLKSTVQAYPDNPDAVWALAVFYDKQLGLKDRADGLYKTFLNMFPADPRAASLRTEQGEPPPPQPRPAPPVPNDNHFKQGLDHYARQEWDAAISAYRQALTIDPKSGSCAYNLGLAYKAKDDLDAAAAAFRHALSIEPDMPKSLYMLGLTEIHRKRNADALTHLNRLISIEPDFAKAHYLLGTVYQTENRPDMAAFHFDRFLKLDPADSAAPQVRLWLDQHRR